MVDFGVHHALNGPGHDTLCILAPLHVIHPRHESPKEALMHQLSQKPLHPQIILFHLVLRSHKCLPPPKRLESRCIRHSPEHSCHEILQPLAPLHKVNPGRIASSQRHVRHPRDGQFQHFFVVPLLQHYHQRLTPRSHRLLYLQMRHLLQTASNNLLAARTPVQEVNP